MHHAVGHSALTRQNHALGCMHHLRVLRDHHLQRHITRRRTHGLRDRVEITHAVINDGNDRVLGASAMRHGLLFV